MRRIGIVLGISLVVTLLGVAAFTYGRHTAWGMAHSGALTARVVAHPVTYGALQSEAAPAAPTNLHATVKGSEIDLTWSAVTGADLYNVYRGTSSHNEGTTPYATGIVSLFFHNQKNIDPKTTYYYTVTAVNRAGQESAPATEASASLTPAAPVTTPTHTTKASGPNFLPLFVIVGLLLLAFGALLLVRSRVRPSLATTGQLPAYPAAYPADDTIASPGASYNRAPSNVWSGGNPPVAQGVPPIKSPYADEGGYPSSDIGMAPPPPNTLPANASTSEGLLSRYGSANSEEVIADSGPLRELLPDERDDPWYNDTDAVSPLSGARFRAITDDNPAWPVQRPREYGAADDAPDSRRTLLLVGAGASFVLGVMALFLFLFFNFVSASGTTTPRTAGGTPLPAAATATPLVSPTATTIPAPPTAIVAISSGGSGAGAFTADAEVSGGDTHTVADHIDTSGVQNPAPEAVYQSERYGEFTYHLGGFTPNGTYTVRLHFAEIYFKSPGQRIFNVVINGQQVLTNFDIIAAVGAPDKAIVQTFTTQADGSGMITIEYHNGSQNNAKSSGIEVFAAG